MTANVAPNYQYWRDHGGTWAVEYAHRKTRMALYHIQEIMLAQYVLEHSRGRVRPLRVLEFGCGVGRHLSYLKDLPGVEVHGFDQSESMVDSMRSWASPGWFAERIVTGSPTGPLPYEAGTFDIVYTAEVLVHVRPEHLSETLAELCRVCRGHVLHLETSPDFPVYAEVHSGCWKHDLPAAYATLGRKCEVLDRGYRAHTPYRVTVGERPIFRWDPLLLAMFRRMEESMDRGFDASDSTVRAALAERDELAAKAERTLAERDELAAKAERTLAERDELAATARRTAAELTEATSRAATAEEQLRRAVESLDSTRARLEASCAEAERASEALRSSETALESSRTVIGGLEATVAALERRERASIAAELAAEARVESWRSRARELEIGLESLGAAMSATREQHSRFVESIRAALG